MKRVVIALIAAIAAIICFVAIANAYKYKFRAQENISVTGSAEIDFESDLVVWSASYSRKSMNLQEAYAALKQDEGAIRRYLAGKGIAAAEIIFSSININKEYSYTYDAEGNQRQSTFSGYNLTQNVTVTSKDIPKVETISREVTELIQSGIELNSQPPSYYYSKLSDLKLDLLAKASADAKKRAETIAENAGKNMGKLKKATMGVFQIVGKNSNEDYSYGGAFNISSKSKTATITVKADYAVK
ncbi:SIMPL domain-containing protein [Haoranjiania flava]|uniref:SIMPL domain-containing protein n=1 Tax=Haoranjiania flava TaxID=1856322 RepID=A0AAE3IQA2_9BACT|nr:SIMPL domain-containing protein [Haoranjiania flava]MCU7695181.1 SIMPL domain-containing protein [Haoranjiania flava]